jgi:membrane protein implicated in regulation of membrane protease activity
MMIFIALLIVGMIVILLLKALIHFIVPLVAAVVTYFLTSNLTYAGLAFAAIAVLELILKRK